MVPLKKRKRKEEKRKKREKEREKEREVHGGDRERVYFCVALQVISIVSYVMIQY